MGASALLTFAYLWATPAASDKSSSSKTRPSARSSWRFGPLTTVATAAVAIAVVIVAKQQLMPSSALAVGSSNNDAERIRIDMYDPKEERNSSNAAAFENELQRIGARIGDTAGRVTDRELWLDVLDRDIIPPSPSTTRSSRDE